MKTFQHLLGVLAFAIAPALLPEPAYAEDPDTEATASTYFSVDEFRERRARIFDAMGENAVLVLLSEEAKVRNDDVDWPFRQDHNLLYLTGLNSADMRLVLIKNGRDSHAHLFHQLDDPMYEKWHGKLPDEDTLKAATGIENIHSGKDFEGFLNLLLKGYNTQITKGRKYAFEKPEYPQLIHAVRDGRATLWLPLGNRRGLGEIKRPREVAFAEKFTARFPDLQVANISPVISSQREIKSEAELTVLKRAIDITVEGHKAAMLNAPVAEYEYQVRATIDYLFASNGAHWGFPAITASGNNTSVLHYAHPHERIDKDGLFLVDIGAEVEHYTADVTRTFPVSGTFSAAQKEIYEAALTASDKAISIARRGRDIADIERTILDVQADALLALGLITEKSDEQVYMYNWHGYGHSIGLDVHDTLDRYGKLRTGMVIAIEPGIYIRRNVVEKSDTYKELDEEAQERISKALDKYDGIGVRIEDNVQITARGAILLSAAAPRTVAAIEDFMAAGMAAKFDPQQYIYSRLDN
ncbi:aminopeptidase P family protein [uncultured Microbulbifer sp.]|uniref:aminopeptidase P family protein n=1 Tax=uncultured Microbulbifer sp. TaxID=348147 RepID=UPI0025D4134C|nr:aminopeptidase P family protein [uncultured Microbulbifer sp.]